MIVRPASAADAASLARIYNEAIEERSATFETVLRTEDEVVGWFDGVHPIISVVDDGQVVAFARASEYRPRECYRGVFDFGVYTASGARRRGAATLAMRELITRSREAGAWKLVARIFVENVASRALVEALGFREVGVYHRHAKLDGRWKDVVIVEKFLAPTGAAASMGPPPPRPPRDEIVAALRSATPETRAQALAAARSLLDAQRRPDPDLLDAILDAFFGSRRSDAASRARFVELFRAYAALSPEGTGEVTAALFGRLARVSMSADLEAFYEALYLVKQIARGADLAAHLPALLAWAAEAIDAPASLRGRIAPGNVASLAMTLASSASPSEEDKRVLADLATRAKERHRVEPPAAIRPSLVPVVPTPPPPPPPPPPLPPPPLPEVTEPEPLLFESTPVLPEKPPPKKGAPKKKRSRKKRDES